MTRNFYIILYTLLLISPVNGQQYYIEGTEALRNREYLKADSLLSLSIENLEVLDAFYNRAIARLGLNNFQECCEDLKKMSELYNDAESARLYNLYCCDFVDTTYYDRKFNPIENKKYRYYVVKKIHKYSCDTTFTYHKRYSSNGGTILLVSGSSIKSFDIDRTDVFAKSFIHHGNEVFSFIIPTVPVNNSTYKIEEFKQSISQKLANEFNELDNLKNEYLIIRTIINPHGEFFKINSFSGLQDIMSDNDFDSYETFLYQIFKEMPKYEPILFNDNPVYFQSEFHIELQ